MSQTPRTITELFNLLADNSTGNITADRIRDCFYSIIIHAELRCVDNASGQTIGTSFTKITQWNQTGPSRAITADASGNNRVTVPVEGVYRVSFDASFSGEGSWEFQIRKNGGSVPENSLVAVQESGPLADLFRISLRGTVSLSASDFIEVFASRSTGSETLVMSWGTMTVEGIL